MTPEPFIQEIWNSLPTFRKLLSYPDGWESTRLNAWQILNASATSKCHEYIAFTYLTFFFTVATEMIQFPISLLTAAALIEGATASLIDFYEHNIRESEFGEETAPEQAVAVMSDTVKDIRELLNISSVSCLYRARFVRCICLAYRNFKPDMKSCRRWLRKIIQTVY